LSVDVKKRVVAEAFAAGAIAVRIVSARDDAGTRERMRAAFAGEDFATWGYDEQRAMDASSPRTLLAGAASVVCAAMAYGTPAPAGRPPLSGRVSNYAWSSEDYHGKMRGLLRRVAAVLDTQASASSTRIVCDTAPLAERAFAERAGMGWVGKHTNLILPGIGSYVFLGEVVTTLALEPDEPLRKSCGSCSRCVSACPTGALRGDYTIDARLCISDLTQRRDGIPIAMRPLIGDWIWGCDLCQQACPPTRRASPRVDRSFEAPDAERAFPDLQALLSMRAGAFKRRFGKTAMGWRGAAVLRRNAAAALGNELDRATVPALERALREDPHPTVRGHAAWALGRIASPQALNALRSRLHEEPQAQALAEIKRALEPFSRNDIV
jgi:epoxyqueuosine reductase